jgi:ppGpp synthetase/RelA/SpoT-type nucleotidyltranferase
MPDELVKRYESRLDLLRPASDRLERETKDALEGVSRVDRVYFRVKDPDRFAQKALNPLNEPPYGDPLVEVEDQIAGRVLTFFREDIEVVKARVEAIFTPVEGKRRRPEKDEEFGYESYHLICMIPPHVVTDAWEARSDLPHTFELQIRTLFMHAWAEPQHDLAYKRITDLPHDVRKELYWIAASAWGADSAYQRIRAWERENEGNAST